MTDMTTTTTIKINPTFKKLIPPLSKDEFAQLEQNILTAGKIRDPLVVWNDILIDGHNRHKIAKKHGLHFEVESMDFANEEEAKIWIIDHQLGRRNLPHYVKMELAQMKEPIIRAAAKERQAEFYGNQYTGKLADRGKDADKPVNTEKAGDDVFTNIDGLADTNGLLTKSSKVQSDSEKLQDNPTKIRNSPINTRKELADMAGVSEDTYRKAAAIMKSKNVPPEVIQDLREGKRTIHAVYKEFVAGKKDVSNARTGKKDAVDAQIVPVGTEDAQVAEKDTQTTDNDTQNVSTKHHHNSPDHNSHESSAAKTTAQNLIDNIKHQIFDMVTYMRMDEENKQIAHDTIDELEAAIVEARKQLK